MRPPRLPRVYFLLLLIAYALTLGVRVHYLKQKNGLHRDEVWSLTLANRKYFGWTMYAQENTPYRGEDLRAAAFVNRDDTLAAALSKLWRNTRDTAHSNFYYSLLRTALVGADSPDIKLLIWRGGILNLLLFSVEFFAFFWLLRQLFPRSPALALLGVMKYWRTQKIMPANRGRQPRAEIKLSSADRFERGHRVHFFDRLFCRDFYRLVGAVRAKSRTSEKALRGNTRLRRRSACRVDFGDADLSAFLRGIYFAESVGGDGARC